jgi:hypothetical protein
MRVNFSVDTHAQDGVPVYGFCKNSAGVQMASCYKERSLYSLITVFPKIFLSVLITLLSFPIIFLVFLIQL